MRETDYRNIIWDWNGTLLADVEICVISMNCLLERRRLPSLSISRYRDVFSFPVKTYYEGIGFDFSNEAFEIPALEFIEEFERNLPDAQLMPDAENLLSYFKEKEYRQFVLSAMEQHALSRSIRNLGIDDYFEMITGIDDHYANGKKEAARRLMSQARLERKHSLLIGDTLHDMEVAQYLGIDCILVSAGHQSEERLLATGYPVVVSLADLLMFL